MKKIPYNAHYKSSSFLQVSPTDIDRPQSVTTEGESPRHPLTQVSNDPSELSVTICSAWESEEGFPLFYGEGTVTHRTSDHHIAGVDYFTVPEFSMDECDQTLVINLKPAISFPLGDIDGAMIQEPEQQDLIQQEDRETIEKLVQIYKDQDAKINDTKQRQPQVYITLTACKDSMSKSQLLKRILNKFNPKSPADLFRKNRFKEVECPQCMLCKTPLAREDLFKLFPQYDQKQITKLIELYGQSLTEKKLNCPCRKILEKVMRFDIKRSDSKQFFEWDNKEKQIRKILSKVLVLQKNITTHIEGGKRNESKLKQDYKKTEKYYKEIVKLAGCYKQSQCCTQKMLKDGGIELLRMRHLLDSKLNTKR